MRRAGSTLHVFTFKEGLLSAAAHDLRLRFERFTCRLDGVALAVTIEVGSLRVDGPVRGGIVHPEEYDAHRRAEIERAAQREVLRAERFPTAEFSGEAAARPDGFDVRGNLTLAGREGALSFAVKRDGTTYRAAFELRPSVWGIAPYSAMLGTMRVQDRVRVELAFSEAG